MRISDWSSDVCSSDLLLPSPSNPQNPRSDRALPDGAWSALEPLPTDTYPNSAIPRSSMRGGSAQDPHQLSSRQFILSNWLGGVAEQPFAMWWAAEQPPLHQIGRASCRERVCKYV